MIFSIVDVDNMKHGKNKTIFYVEDVVVSIIFTSFVLAKDTYMN